MSGTAFADLIDGTPEPVVKIEATAKIDGEKNRGRPMAKSPLGKNRTWLCDGEYVWFRRAKSNPETLARHEKFIRTGQYKHVGNSDDVEVWQLTEASAFKRTPVNLVQLDIPTLRRTAVLLAVKGDFGGYVDALDELASRIKGVRGGALDMATMQKIFLGHVGHMQYLITIRGGPSAVTIGNEVKAVRAARGQSRGKLLLLPT